MAVSRALIPKGKNEKRWVLNEIRNSLGPIPVKIAPITKAVQDILMISVDTNAFSILGYLTKSK
jgi:hypothetical protein